MEEEEEEEEEGNTSIILKIEFNKANNQIINYSQKKKRKSKN